MNGDAKGKAGAKLSRAALKRMKAKAKAAAGGRSESEAPSEVTESDTEVGAVFR